MKKHLTTIILIGALLIGAGLLAYPTFSNWWNSYHQSRAVVSYASAVAQINDDEYREIIASAVAYNEELAETGTRWVMSEEEAAAYDKTLAITVSGIMAYVEIPKIDVQLPIYHGTDEAVLQVAIGHLAGTSLPVGGASTHCVISGHRGLPSARLFTDLDRLTTGDRFLVRTLDEVLTYEIDQILIVEPTDLSALEIEKGKDYCTLVTCTPYGINTHRLLVRGHRVKTEDDITIRITSDAMQVDEVLVALFLAVPVLVLLAIIVMARPRRKRRDDYTV
ncbi:MAG: class C sortase [Firmicutes bacterium]|nr:class C sortase [Bacillota bacterium]